MNNALAQLPLVLLGTMVVTHASAQDYVATIEFSQKTAAIEWAETHDSFTLQIRRGPWQSSTYCNIAFPAPRPPERQKGSYETYELFVDASAPGCGQLLADELQPNRVSVVTSGVDMWLPAWFAVWATTEQGSQSKVALGSWPGTLWFSLNASASNGRHVRPHWALQHVSESGSSTYSVAAPTLVALTTQNCQPCSEAQLAAARRTTNSSAGIRGRDMLGSHIGLILSYDDTSKHSGAHTAPISPEKQTICGEFKQLRYFGYDGDWAFNIAPSAYYDSLFQWGIAQGFPGVAGKDHVCPGNNCIHAEIHPSPVFPKRDFFQISVNNAMGESDLIGTPEFCVYGPWVADVGHFTANNQEIHPIDLVWWQDKRVPPRDDQRAAGISRVTTYHTMMLQDGSHRYEAPEHFPCESRCPRPWAKSPRQSEVRIILEAVADGSRPQIYTVNDRYSFSVIPSAVDEALHSYALEFNGARILTVSNLQPGHDPGVALDSLCYEQPHFQSVRLPSGQVVQFPVPARVHGQLILLSNYGGSFVAGYQVLDITRYDYGSTDGNQGP